MADRVIFMGWNRPGSIITTSNFQPPKQPPDELLLVEEVNLWGG